MAIAVTRFVASHRKLIYGFSEASRGWLLHSRIRLLIQSVAHFAEPLICLSMLVGKNSGSSRNGLAAHSWGQTFAN